MDIDKYYTPQIKEFHVGFRYEKYVNKEWVKKEVDNDTITIGDYESFTDLFYILNEYEKVRTKYLDRSDIEELGWKYFESEKIATIYILDNYNLVLYNTGNIKIEDQNYIDIKTDIFIMQAQP